MSQPITGRQVAAGFVGFFGIVIAVNVMMAREAIGSFGGTVVENSYVASQKYNAWLAEGRAQQRLGWQSVLALDGERRPVLTIGDAAGDGRGFTATGTAHHPLGRAPDMPVRLVAAGDGRLVAATPLPAGRWQVRLTVRRGSDVLKLDEILS